MQKFLLFAGLLSLTACATNAVLVTIEPQQQFELDYPNYAFYEVSIQNKSMAALDVAVKSKEDEQQVRGFGLGLKAKAEVDVERGNKLVFENTSNQAVRLKLEIAEKEIPKPQQDGKYINFTLHNSTAKSIPLIIPSVMNPNLAPFSNSGVSLAIGQEIFFKDKGKKKLLLTVDSSIAQGSKLDVAALIKEVKAAG